MLENLVESKNRTKENLSLGKFLITTLGLVIMLCLSGVVWSLFAKELSMNNSSFELSSLIAPVPMPENAPPKPEPIEKRQNSDNSDKTKSEVPTRQVNMLRVNESTIVPKETSVTPNSQKERPNVPFKLGKIDTEGKSVPTDTVSRFREPGDSGKPIGNTTKPIELEEEGKPPTIKKPVEEAVKVPKKDVVLSGGVVNGKAISLPKPNFPAAAKAINAGGNVNVQVTIDEKGNVVSARAVSGHPMLRGVSEASARNAKFSPTFLTNQPVKVTGVIVYNFTNN